MSLDVIAHATAGPFAAACALLAFAGASKILHPVATRPAAAALGLPTSSAAVRTLGLVEAVAAIAGLAFGAAAAAVVATVYVALAAAAWRLLVRSPGTACGCIGASDAPVTPTHIVVNGVAAITAAIAIAAGSPLSAASGDAWSRLAFAALVGCGAWLLALMLDALPALHAATSDGSSR